MRRRRKRTHAHDGAALLALLFALLRLALGERRVAVSVRRRCDRGADGTQAEGVPAHFVRAHDRNSRAAVISQGHSGGERSGAGGESAAPAVLREHSLLAPWPTLPCPTVREACLKIDGVLGRGRRRKGGAIRVGDAGVARVAVEDATQGAASCQGHRQDVSPGPVTLAID